MSPVSQGGAHSAAFSLPHYIRRLGPLAWLCAAVLLASIRLPLPENGQIWGLPSPCPLWNRFHIPCAACGLTRAFVCCGHGQFLQAFFWNPLGPFLFISAFTYVVLAVWRPAWCLRHKTQNLALAGFASAALSAWAMRLNGFFPLS